VTLQWRANPGKALVFALLCRLRARCERTNFFQLFRTYPIGQNNDFKENIAMINVIFNLRQRAGD
jgi:hypothetical protein